MANTPWNRLIVFCVIAGLAAGAGRAHAADPQPYSVDIAGTGHGGLDTALHDSALLVSLRERAPVSPFALIGRARGDIGRLETALTSFGYYQGHVEIRIAGRALTDPDLPGLLDAMPKGTEAKVTIKAMPGPLYHLRHITIDGTVPDDARAKLGLHEGQPAIAADVLAAGSRLQTQLEEDGYARARVAPPVATADDGAHVLDIVFTAEPGRRAHLGAIAIIDLHDVNESYVRRLLTVHTGDLYQPSRIESARQALLSTGLFSGVTVRAARSIDADGRIALTFDMQEREKRTVALSAAYSTDLGISLSASWSHRNLFGNGEQLNLSAATTGVGGSSTNALGYNITAQYQKPNFLELNQTLEFDLGAIKQSLDAYDQTAETAGASIRRKLWDDWTGSAGVTVTQEQIAQEGLTRDYQLLALPLAATYDSTGLANPLDDATHGVRATLSATPTHAFGHPASNFVILQASGSTYLDLSNWGLSDPGRSILALRALAASVQGATQFELPPDQRLYVGGSATVRGYDYQSVGPRFADGNPIGGTSATAMTVEFRQRVLDSFGAVAFLDAGEADDGSTPFTGTMHMGAGLGARYYTPIGPVRLDVAFPLSHLPDETGYAVYIGLGQAF